MVYIKNTNHIIPYGEIMDKDAIIKDLTQKITSEELPQSHWLTERDISEMYGISRTPVREILRTLTNTGLVEQEAGKGFRVKRLDFDDIIEIFNAREAVETMATRLACKFGDDAFHAEIAGFKQRLLGIDVAENVIQAMNLGRNLHDCIADAAGNSILSEFYLKLKNLVALTRILTRQIPSVEENSKEYHLKIIEALEARDAAKAERTMREHLRLTCKLTVQGYINIRTGYDDSEVEEEPSGK